MTWRKDLWTRLTRPADGAAHSYEEASRWALRNAMFLLVAAGSVAGVLVFAAVGAAEVFLASAAVGIGCLAGYVLSRDGHRRGAALCAIVPLDAALFYNTQNFGPGLFETAYVSSMALTFFALDRKDTRTIAAAIGLTLGAAAMGAITWWQPIAALAPGQASALRLGTIALTISTVGSIFMYFLVHRDRTIGKLHSVAHEAAAASEAKSRFLANMSHELRTPLNGVLGVLDILDETALDLEQREHVHSARTAGRSLLGIIDDILDLAKVEAGMMVLAPESFDLRVTIAEVVRATAIQVRGRSVSVVARYPEHVPAHVIGDAKRIRQVLVNLLGNAAKFTEIGEIAVTVSCEAGEADTAVFSLVVSDTGIGIPRDALSRIFDKFQQVDDSTSRQRGGTGLGLAIVKELVTHMHGNVHVDSEPGHGSRFSIRLPLRLAAPSQDALAPTARPVSVHADGDAPTATAAPAATGAAPAAGSDVRSAPDVRDVRDARDAPAAATSSPAAEPRGQPHVLVVEDNLVNQKVAVHRLQRLGCRVDVAGDGNEALARIEQTPYAMVFMDVQMPGMDGYETTRAIRARERQNGGRLRIVAMTAHAFPDDRQRCLDAGMDDHVSKPVVPDVLAAVLHRHLVQT